MAHFAHTIILVVLLALVLFVPELSARGGFRSKGSGIRGSGGSKTSSTSSGGTWFSKLFGSKAKPSSSSALPSSPSRPSRPDYPRQPPHNPVFDLPMPNGMMHTGGHAPPPPYGWATGVGSGSVFRGSGFGSSPPQPSGFGAFHPQNHQTSSSYHFVPIFLPIYHSSHSYSHNSRASASSSSAANETFTTPSPPITTPIVYEMDNSSLQPNQTPIPALVVAVNNMVVYGDLQAGKHLTMVIDEHYADPGEIPARFMDVLDEDEVTDYNPARKTTVAPPIEMAVHESHNDTQVLDNHWFSDVDGAI